MASCIKAGVQRPTSTPFSRSGTPKNQKTSTSCIFPILMDSVLNNGTHTRFLEPLSLSLEAPFHPMTLQHRSHHNPACLHNAHKLRERLRSKVAMRKRPAAGKRIVLAISYIQPLRQIRNFELRVRTAPARNLEHALTDIETDDVFGAHLRELVADGPRSAACVRDPEAFEHFVRIAV